ncbi:MAG: xanthine dehydrogenase family protein subunit M [Steroidobacteraceae bacterium]|nr:xanthine dehydrogenase family protein subunit M [Steroidobacteraceae bacterium]
MMPFAFQRATALADAFAAAANRGRYVAGGTTLVDLMREGVETPERLVDINALPLHEIRLRPDHLEIGALARMAQVAANADVMRLYPAISQALLLSASAQLRNMASMGGNLLQRTRCPYFRDVTSACNKREPGSGCPARDGVNRLHAILGTSEHCVATHASDVAVALVALDASVRIASPEGERRIPLEQFYRVPGDTPHIEHVLRPGELIVAIEVPAGPHTEQSTYVKVRDRQSYEFAVTSAAVALAVDDGRILDARVAAGGVATVPWRMRHVEAALIGQPLSASTFRAAARLSVEGAVPLTFNAFKIELLPRTLVRALETLETLAVPAL